jgi:hypothetical protein
MPVAATISIQEIALQRRSMPDFVDPEYKTPSGV